MKTMSDAIVALEAEAATRLGTSHTICEDSYLVEIADGLFVIADGMGGHRDGHIASQTIVEDIRFATRGVLSFEDRIKFTAEAISNVNHKLYEQTQLMSNADISGSTVVALIIEDGYACCLWVGDSRLYLMRDGELYMISSDHAADNGALTRAVGAGASVAIDRRLIEITDRDVFLLCSDGLLKGMSEDMIGEFMKDPVQHTAERMLAKAVAGGSTDDITLILVWTRQSE